MKERSMTIAIPITEEKIYYWQGKTMQEIGDAMGVSKMAVCKRIKRIEQQIKEQIISLNKNNL